MFLSFVLRTLSQSRGSVQIFHLIDNSLWGEVDGSALQGAFECGRINCTLISSDSKTNFLETLKLKYFEEVAKHSRSVTVAMYNVHTWKTLAKWPYQPSCDLPTDLTMVESEESYSRFKSLFDNAFSNFDGNSTTHPMSSVQRVYIRNLNESQFLPLKTFSSLIQGATFVASTCHRGHGAVKREIFVEKIAKRFRVDSLGKCMHTPTGPEGIVLGDGKTALESLLLKQKAISNYMFYLAFENSIEPGYVTEKVFDALIAGVVPVYLGASQDCRKLLPHPNAAIFLDTFDNNIPKLVTYLNYLAKNSTAYEEHRQWRTNFSPVQMSQLMTKSWPCRVCEWALDKKLAHQTTKAKSSRRKCQ